MPDVVNGQPAVHFDGTNDYLAYGHHAMFTKDMTGIAVVNDEWGLIAFYGVWSNRYKQNVWTRFKNFVTRKGSTAKWLDTDFDEIGRSLAEQYDVGYGSGWEIKKISED